MFNARSSSPLLSGFTFLGRDWVAIVEFGHRPEVAPLVSWAGWRLVAAGSHSCGNRWSLLMWLASCLLERAERRGRREPGGADWSYLVLSGFPGDPPLPCAPRPGSRAALLPPSPFSPSFSFKPRQYLLRRSSLSLSAFLWQNITVHSAAGTYLKERNLKLSLGEFK